MCVLCKLVTAGVTDTEILKEVALLGRAAGLGMSALTAHVTGKVDETARLMGEEAKDIMVDGIEAGWVPRPQLIAAIIACSGISASGEGFILSYGDNEGQSATPREKMH